MVKDEKRHIEMFRKLAPHIDLIESVQTINIQQIFWIGSFHFDTVSTPGLSIRPKTRISKIGALKEIIRA